MFLTSAECRTLAEEKLAEADRDQRHRKRLITAAEGCFSSLPTEASREAPRIP
jgi:hypothetical protein